MTQHFSHPRQPSYTERKAAYDAENDLIQARRNARMAKETLDVWNAMPIGPVDEYPDRAFEEAALEPVYSETFLEGLGD